MNGLLFRRIAVIAGGLGLAIGFAQEPSPLLVPGPVIEVTGSRGKFDFLEIDEANHRLLGSHTADGTVDIFDLTTNRLVARPATGAAQHAAFDPRSGKYFAGVSEPKQIATRASCLAARVLIRFNAPTAVAP